MLVYQSLQFHRVLIPGLVSGEVLSGMRNADVTMCAPGSRISDFLMQSSIIRFETYLGPLRT
jgi:hypothetical protein